MPVTRCHIGLGGNLGARRDNLEQAAWALHELPHVTGLQISPVFETPALVPPGAPDDWNIPYLNAVASLDWDGDAPALLHALKSVELAMGRAAAPRWAPRLIDLDLLLFGDNKIEMPDLQVPHAGLWDRSFVLDPLKHLVPSLIPPDRNQTVLHRARALPGHAPLWMEIFNLTPDSFSDGGALPDIPALKTRIAAAEEAGVQIFDLGAESTRPGAEPITAEQEWARLEPALRFLQARYATRFFRPLIGVDTRRASVARQALELGADIVNDVSGGADPAMMELLRHRPCHYVFMHSLSIPADGNITLDAEDPVQAVHDWAKAKLDHFAKHNITFDRLIFDPGIGFGKTPVQSLKILRNIDAFFDLPVRIMVGHSRKSFMKQWTALPAAARDPESIGLSLRLAEKGVDILRVHDAPLHRRAWRGSQESG